MSACLVYRELGWGHGGVRVLGPMHEGCDWSVHVGGGHTVWGYNLKPDS